MDSYSRSQASDDELLRIAPPHARDEGRARSEVAELIAARKPTSELMGWVQAVPNSVPSPALARV